MNYRMHHLRRMATTAWAKADLARDAAHECLVESIMARRKGNEAKEWALLGKRGKLERIEKRYLWFGRCCHAEACKIAKADPSP